MGGLLLHAQTIRLWWHRFWYEQQSRIASRERFTIADGVVLITYKTRFEFRLSNEFESTFRAFISEFGQEAIAEARDQRS